MASKYIIFLSNGEYMKRSIVVCLFIVIFSLHAAEMRNAPRSITLEQKINILTNQINRLHRELEVIHDNLVAMKIWIMPKNGTLEFYCSRVNNHIYTIPQQFTENDIVYAKTICFDVNNFNDYDKDEARKLIDDYLVTYLEIIELEMALHHLREQLNEYKNLPLRHRTT